MSRKVSKPQQIEALCDELAARLRHVKEDYRTLYDSVVGLGMSGGSVGQVRRASSRTDPTSRAAMSGEQRRLSGALAAVERRLQRVRELLIMIDDLVRADQPPDSPRQRTKPVWRVVTWTRLSCGCERDDSAPPWWIVTRTCAEHVATIPLAERIPFLEAPGLSSRYGPFQPIATGPAA